jgi:hypothetical protein
MWLPEPSIYRTWVMVSRWDLPQKTRSRGGRRPRARKSERAAQYRAIMTAEPQLTRAALARRLGVSRAWITRVLADNRAG